jgi:hypothetical protein
VAALADEGGPTFFGGVHEMLLSASSVVDRVAEAFRAGGGVPQSAYDERFWDGMDRFSGAWFDHALVGQWVPAMPDVERKFRHGADVDVGCGVDARSSGWRKRFLRAGTSGTTPSRRVSSAPRGRRARWAWPTAYALRFTMRPSSSQADSM